MQLINASARYELLSANHQLIDFHLNRVIKTKFAHNKRKRVLANDTIGEVNEQEESNEKPAPSTRERIPSDLFSDEKSRVNA